MLLVDMLCLTHKISDKLMRATDTSGCRHARTTSALAWSGRAEMGRTVFASVQPVARHHAEPERLTLLERELRLTGR